MTTRDLTVLLLAIAAAVIVGILEGLISLTPENREGLVFAPLVGAIAWSFYKIGKSG